MPSWRWNYEIELKELFVNKLKKLYPGKKIDDFSLDNKGYIIIKNKPVRFKYTGEIWHHFGEYVRSSVILRRTTYWVLIGIRSYNKALVRAIAREKERCFRTFGLSSNISGTPLTHISKDYFEVYIESAT